MKRRNGRHPNQTPPELTRRRQRDFLEVLAETGLIKMACKQLAMSLRTPYEWAQRSESFAKRLDAVRDRGEKLLLAEYEGIIHNRISAGAKDAQSAVLTMFRVKRLDPRYRDNVSINVAAAGPVAIMLGLDGPQDVVSGAEAKALASGESNSDA